MVKKMNLLSLPIKVDLLFPIFKINDNYSFRLTNELDSKLLSSQPCKKVKTYILLEITDDNIKLEAITHTLHSFINPIDFTLPKTNTNFYYNFYNTLLSPNIEDVFTLVNDIQDKLPLYLPPTFSTIPVFNTVPTITPMSHINEVKTIKFDWKSDEVPLQPDQSYYEYLRTKDGDELFFRLLNILTAIFNEKPVLSKHDNLLKEKYKELNDISKTHYLYYLPLVGYYTNKGPFARCWIRFKYDPRKSKNNYVYQRLVKFKLNVPINFIYEDLDLLKFVKENENLFVKGAYDHFYGFFREELIKYLKRYFRNKKVEEMIDK